MDYEIGVYDLKWNYIRSFWTNSRRYGLNKLGDYCKQGNYYYKALD